MTASFADIPEYGKIQKALEKFGHEMPLSSKHAHGWLLGMIMEQALTTAGWPCTPAKAARSIKQS